MARLPSVLQDMNAFFRDSSYAGQCNTVTLPTVAVKTADFVMAGVGGDMQKGLNKLEAMESTVTISNYAPRIIGLLGSNDSRDEVMTFRGALDDDGTIRTVIVRQQGLWKQMEFNEWAPESEGTNQFTISVEMFELEIDGQEVIHVDKMNNVFRVNGVDRNAAIRSALAQ
jgi:P2 family phage contractile tail tube protein